MKTHRAMLAVVILLLLASACFSGDLKCHVTQAGSDVSGAKVTLSPINAVNNTNADGVCEFNGLAAGRYTVTAEKVIGGTLYGARERNIRVGARSHVTRELRMERAINLGRYMPQRNGDSWQYHCENTEAGVTHSSTRREKVEGTATIAGDTVNIIVVTESGGSGFKQYQRVDGDGWTVYGESYPGDTWEYDPPIGLPILMIVGDRVKAETRIHHSCGDPDTRMGVQATLVGFDPVTVPAGTFANCPRIEFKMEIGGEPEEMQMWLGRHVGQLKVHEKREAKEHKRELEEYSVRPPIIRPIRPIPRIPIRPHL